MSKRILWITLVVSLIMAMCVPAFAASSKGTTVSFKPGDKSTLKAKVRSEDVLVISIDKAAPNETVDISYKFDEDTYGFKFPSTVTTNVSGSARIEIEAYPKTTTSGKGISFTVSVNNDGADKPKTFKATYNISITGDAPVLSSDALATHSKDALWVGEDVSDSDFAGAIDDALTSGDGPITYKATNLPKGLKIQMEDDDGYEYPVITGTPTKAGTYAYSVTATNKNLGKSATGKGTITVYQAPEIASTTLKAATQGKKYSAKIKVTGSIGSYDIRIASSADIGSHDLKVTVDKNKGTINVDAKEKTGIPAYPKGGKISFDVSIWPDTARELDGISSDVFELEVVPVAPKLKSNKFKDGKASSDYSSTLELASGTLPCSIDLEVDSAAMEKYGLTSTDSTATAFDILGLTVIKSPDIGKVMLYAEPLKNVAVKNLPITVTFTSPYTEQVKPVTAKASLTITGTAPKFPSLKNNLVVNVKAGAPYTSFDYYASLDVTGSGPLTLTAKGADKLGITIEESSDKTGFKMSGNFVETAAKGAITLTAANSAGKASAKITINVLTPPEITGTDKLKALTVGKSYSGALKANGSKTVVWSLSDVPGTKSADFVAVGLKLDKTGKITGTPKFWSEDITFTVVASNDVGKVSEDITLSVGVAKPKITVTKPKDGEVGKEYSVTLSATGVSLDWTIENAGGLDLSTDLGVALSVDKVTATVSADSKTVKGYIAGTPKAPTVENDKYKAQAVTVTVTDVAGQTAKAKVSVGIRDKAPKLPSGLSVTIGSKDSSGVEYKLHLTQGTGNYNWTFKTPKGFEKIEKQEGVLASNDVTISITPSNEETSASGAISITVQNAADSKLKATGSLKVTYKATGDVATTSSSVPAYENALPTIILDVVEDESNLFGGVEENEVTDETAIDEKAEEEVTDEEAAAEGTMSFKARGALTSEQLAAINAMGYKVVAVLDEITVTADGEYDIPTVTLDEETAQAGAKLGYLAFPIERSAIDEEEHPLFTDSANTEITTVPEDLTVGVTTWFNAGFTYQPVIVIEAE